MPVHEYYLKRKEECKEYQKQFYLTHKGYYREYNKKYREAHRFQISLQRKEYLKEYHVVHGIINEYAKRTIKELIRGCIDKKERRKEIRQRFLRNHPEYEGYQKKYMKDHPEKEKRHSAKRRALGFVELNRYFEGSVAHHIDKVHIIYIPLEMHKSTWHDLDSRITMEKINEKAFIFLRQEIEKEGLRQMPLLAPKS